MVGVPGQVLNDDLVPMLNAGSYEMATVLFRGLEAAKPDGAAVSGPRPYLMASVSAEASGGGDGDAPSWSYAGSSRRSGAPWVCCCSVSNHSE